MNQISKEVADKVRRYQRLKREANRLYEELQDYFEEELDGCCVTDFSISGKPDECFSQGDGEYIAESASSLNDTGEGICYKPIKGSKKYVAIDYCF